MNSKRLKIFNVHLKTLTFALICLTLAISCNDSIIESEELVTETTTAVNELKAAVVGDYYVSPKGSDSNNGSESKPFKTFSYAQSMAKAGNVIIFEDGVYTTTSNGFLSTLTKSGTSSAYITYKARNIGGIKPLINCFNSKLSFLVLILLFLKQQHQFGRQVQLYYFFSTIVLN